MDQMLTGHALADRLADPGGYTDIDALCRILAAQVDECALPDDHPAAAAVAELSERTREAIADWRRCFSPDRPRHPQSWAHALVSAMTGLVETRDRALGRERVVHLARSMPPVPVSDRFAVPPLGW